MTSKLALKTAWAAKRKPERLFTTPKVARRKNTIVSEVVSELDSTISIFSEEAVSMYVLRSTKALPTQPQEDSVDDNFHHSVRFLSALFRKTGAMPIYRAAEGWAFKFWSFTFLYSAVLYAATFTLFAVVLFELLSKPQSSATRDEFNANIYNQLFIGTLLLYMTVPLTTWQDANTFAGHLNDWDVFQSRFQEVTRTRLQFFDSYRRQVVLLLASSIFGVASSLLFSPLPAYWKMLPNFINLLFIVMGNYYWVLSCDAVVFAGRQIAARFREETVGNDCSDTLNRYRHLWLNLSCLAESTASSVCRTYGMQLVLGLYLITISLYGLLATAIDASRSPLLMLLYIVATAITVTPCYLLCNKGFAVTHEVKTGMKEELQRMDTLTLDRRAMHEMNLFFQCIYNNHAELSLGGFFTVDRALFKSAGATICTYLIVILQFQMSLKQSDDANMVDNTTSHFV